MGYILDSQLKVPHFAELLLHSKKHKKCLKKDSNVLKL
jgi:hypothetical protein